MKIVCLGNEFLKEDCFAKKVGGLLSGDFEVVNVRDSFELMGIVSSGVARNSVPSKKGTSVPASSGNFVILDVVEGLSEVRKLRVEDLRGDSIVSAHDFDAVYVLKLLGEDVRIIGIPMSGDAEKIRDEVVRLIAS